MVLKEKLVLDSFPYSRLSKEELPQLAVRVMAIVNNHDAEKLKIDAMFDLLELEETQINMLDSGYGPHPLTSELTKLREDRRFTVSSIFFQLKKVTKKKVAGKDKELKLATIAINLHLTKLNTSKNDETFNRRLEIFFNEIKNDEALQDAFETLDFNPLLNELKMTHSKIQELILARWSSTHQRSKIKTGVLRSSILTALMDLFKQIDIAPLKHLDVDYEPFFKDMNGLLNEYRVILNKRFLFNKRKAELKKANEEAARNESNNPVAPATMTMKSIDEVTTEGNTSEEGLAEQQDLNKIAATNSSSMQLPVIEKKAPK